MREQRKLRGYSQESFAHECNLHRTYMGGVEGGDRNISLDNIAKIAKIAKALEMQIAEWFSGIE